MRAVQARAFSGGPHLNAAFGSLPPTEHLTLLAVVADRELAAYSSTPVPLFGWNA